MPIAHVQDLARYGLGYPVDGYLIWSLKVCEQISKTHCMFKPAKISVLSTCHLPGCTGFVTTSSMGLVGRDACEAAAEAKSLAILTLSTMKL
jgi:hypothetical protein